MGRTDKIKSAGGESQGLDINYSDYIADFVTLPGPLGLLPPERIILHGIELCREENGLYLEMFKSKGNTC